ncbi:Uncharacterised protein [Myroides odoratimimus]|nr:Uncharacterised protein [Myroides odoratimimus]
MIYGKSGLSFLSYYHNGIELNKTNKTISSIPLFIFIPIDKLIIQNNRNIILY